MKPTLWPPMLVACLCAAQGLSAAPPAAARNVEDIHAVIKGQLAVFDSTPIEYQGLLHFDVPDQAVYQQWLDEKGSGKFSLAPDIQIHAIRDGRRYLAATTQQNGSEVRYAHDGELYRRYLVTEEYGSIEAGFGDAGRFRSIQDDVPNLTLERSLGPREIRAWAENPALFTAETSKTADGLVVRLKPTDEAKDRGFGFNVLELTLDETRNYAVIRSMATFKGGAALMYEAENFVEYAGSKGSLWLPRKMSSTMFAKVGSRENVPLQTSTFTVDQVELDKSYPDQTFTFNFPDGTRVHDAAADTVYVVGRVEMDNKRIGDLATEARAALLSDLAPETGEPDAQKHAPDLVVTEGPVETEDSSEKEPSVPLVLLITGGLATVAGLVIVKRSLRQNRAKNEEHSERDAA